MNVHADDGVALLGEATCRDRSYVTEAKDADSSLSTHVHEDPFSLLRPNNCSCNR